jgi:hypothetical protein
MVAEISAVEVVHDEVEVFSILEGAADVDQEGVTQLAEEFFLVYY